MKILVCSQVFHPDHSGIAIYSSEFAFTAAEMGHDVCVVTGFPFYPNWEKSEQDKGVLFRRDKLGDVEVFRGYHTVHANPGVIARIAQEISLFASSLVNFLRAGRPDVIVVFVTPISLGFLSMLYKYIFRCKLVINVQDFQIEAADSLGMAGKKVLAVVSRLEALSFRNADWVTSISSSMVDLLRQKKGLTIEKTGFWPNWIGIEQASRILTTGKFRSNNDFSPDDVLVAYAGNIGQKQGLDVLVDTALRFKNAHNLKFIIAGAGSDLVRLELYCSQAAAENVIFLPFLNTDEYMDFLSDVDLVFISQKRTDFDVYFPSKLLGIMAQKRPILLSADPGSELYSIMVERSLALTSSYGDTEKIAGYIERYMVEGVTFTAPYTQRAFEFVCRYDRQAVVLDALNKMEILVSE